MPRESWPPGTTTTNGRPLVVERYDIGVARPPAGSRERHSAGASRLPWLATRPVGHDLSSHERAAALLDTHVDYRVLRALPPPARYPVVTPQGLVRTAVVIDVETIGLDPDHPIIDLAIQRIAFDARGMIVRVGQVRQWFEDPGTAIPAEITRLTGITDADVIGKRIDADEAASLIVSTTVAIAHNTAFDAPRVERRLTAIAAMLGRARATRWRGRSLASTAARSVSARGGARLRRRMSQYRVNGYAMSVPVANRG